jgi:hypothetical protein
MEMDPWGVHLEMGSLGHIYFEMDPQFCMPATRWIPKRSLRKLLRWTEPHGLGNGAHH